MVTTIIKQLAIVGWQQKINLSPFVSLDAISMDSRVNL
ncbi:MAG: hypothetical protein ACJAS2_001176 [Pseudohongiellaceae bacterium]|jgi:hypothetical protein